MSQGHSNKEEVRAPLLLAAAVRAASGGADEPPAQQGVV